ncbi:MAG TPA: hypothetical protein VGV37_12080 [Aliidongia sp.]|uniref:hypothetical protein n=1 Tax=Aliidongia sp. TaxID=1914230 RepID=UPI002DDD4903|nr:hypothetical protein [Aliidongia sp.]HEV2675272.1 hypothetical protein [Aliidongia sp.]
MSALPLLPISTGASPNDGSGDTLRAAMTKVNANFATLATLNRADDYAQLRATAGIPGGMISTLGLETAWDGLGARMAWNAAATAVDDNLTTIKPTGQVGAGRWQAVNQNAALIQYLLDDAEAQVQSIKDRFAQRLYVSDFWKAIDADDTGSITRCFAAARITGGTMVFGRPNRPYVCAGWDISGQATAPVIIDGNSCELVPASTAQSAVITCDNSGVPVSGFAGPATIFRHLNVSGLLVGSSTKGDIDYAVYINGGNPIWYNCGFFAAKVACYYTYYGQYSKFFECQFSIAQTTAQSVCMQIDGGDTSRSSNEIVMVACDCSTGSNLLSIKGGLNIRIFGLHLQNQTKFLDGSGVDQATGALLLGATAAGMGATGVRLYSAYFEVNDTADIVNGLSIGTRIHDATFASTAKITSSTCYDLGLIDCFSYVTMNCTINHPPTNADTASLTFDNNNFIPALNLVHPGPTYVSGQSAAVGLSYNQNMLQSCGATDLGRLASAVPSWSGARPAVAKGTTTNLFQLTLQAPASSVHRAFAGKLHLDLIDDTASTTQFGYGAHVGQTFDIFITCNNTGVPQVAIHQDAAGTDTGLNPGYQAPGVATIAGTVSGDTVVFTMSFPGAGTSGGTAQACAFYRLDGVGINSFYMTPL